MRTSKIGRTLIMLGCASCGGLPAPGGDGQGPNSGIHVSVTPNTDLLDGQLVTIHGAGLLPNENVLVAQCPRDLIDFPEDCGNRQSISADAEGNIDLPMNLSRYFILTNHHAFSCADPGSCVAGVFATSSFADGRVVPLGFRDVGPVPPLPPNILPLSIRVTPSSDLAPGQTVSIDFANLAPAGQYVEVYVRQCRTGAAVTDTGPLYEFPEADCGDLVTYMNVVPAALSIAYPVQYTIQPRSGSPIDCSAPGSCSIYAKASYSFERVASAPISFRAIEPPRAGSVRLDSTNVVEHATFPVMGNGWAPFARIVVEVCPAGGPNEACQNSIVPPLFADAQGAFSTQTGFGATYVWNGRGLTDCTASPGACVVRAYDLRAPASTTVDVPVTMAANARPKGTAELDLHSPLIDGLTVRLKGAGWGAAATFRTLLCKGPAGDFRLCTDIGNDIWKTTDLQGGFRLYRVITPTVEGTPIACASAADQCSIVIADEEAIAATAVQIPVVFATGDQFDVTSSYEPEYEALLEQGVTVSGQPPEELQRRGSSVLMWLLGVSHKTSGTRLPAGGGVRHTTTYTAADYRAWSSAASRFDYTVEEVQKAGGVFWAWYLAGMPPLPTPPSQ